jgi:hypothetical protein
LLRRHEVTISWKSRSGSGRFLGSLPYPLFEQITG